MGISQLWSQQRRVHQMLATQWWDNFVNSNRFKPGAPWIYSQQKENKNNVQGTKVNCSHNSKACIVFKVNEVYIKVDV